MAERSRTLGDFATIALMVGLLAAVTLLPPDTSLAEVRRTGILRVCAPPAYPPLVTGDPAAPGFDIELLQGVAADLGLRLVISANPAIGRDFNPRNWRITRAQCEIIAGGVVASPTTRSFMETTEAHAETGWAVLAPAEIRSLSGLRVGALPAISGLDRIGLSSYLREVGATVTVARSAEDLAGGIADGRFDAGVTEALLAADIAADRGWRAAYLPAPLVRYPVVFGLWKGDLTLKRGLESALRRLDRSGVTDALRTKYLGGNQLEMAAPAKSTGRSGVREQLAAVTEIGRNGEAASDAT